MKSIGPIALAITLIHQSLHAQGGPLTPPGAPAPTMKSLDQIEPRIAVQSLAAAPPYTLSAPGSYYLTGNIAVASGNAISITTHGVTLDLNGFTISSTANPASGHAIQLGSGIHNVAISNGHIRSGTTLSGSTFTPLGFSGGIGSVASNNTSVDIHRLTISGIAGSGIVLGISLSNSVSHCTVDTASSLGIYAGLVSHCSVQNCGSNAILATMVGDCSAHTINLSAIEALTVTNCRAYSDSGIGISATNVTNSHGTSNTGSAGISSGGNVSFSQGTRTGGTAITAAIAIGCTSGGGIITSPQKHLGTP